MLGLDHFEGRSWHALMTMIAYAFLQYRRLKTLNAIFYVLSTGCQWQALPKDLPPKSTAHSYFMLWDWDGTLERVHHALYVATREREGREASPTAAIIDSQSAKAAQKGAPRLTRRALMRPRRSPAANGISWSTRSACC